MAKRISDAQVLYRARQRAEEIVARFLQAFLQRDGVVQMSASLDQESRAN